MDKIIQSTPWVEFGPETLQDNNMHLLGIGINLDHGLIICLGCRSVVVPKNLYSHIRLPGHHGKEDFYMGQRLAFADQEFCDNLISCHNLDEPRFSQPDTIIPAIPGLRICMEMMYCTGCGCAARHKGSINRRHLDKPCQQFEILTGPSQTFFPSTRRNYFAIRLPPNLNRPNLSTEAISLFHKQFTSDPYATYSVQATKHPREMKLFLKTENWLVEVDGMTGSEITQLARNSKPDFRPRVKKTVLCYLAETVAILEGVEGSIHIAIGDYNR